MTNERETGRGHFCVQFVIDHLLKGYSKHTNSLSKLPVFSGTVKDIFNFPLTLKNSIDTRFYYFDDYQALIDHIFDAIKPFSLVHYPVLNKNVDLEQFYGSSFSNDRKIIRGMLNPPDKSILNLKDFRLTNNSKSESLKEVICVLNITLNKNGQRMSSIRTLSSNYKTYESETVNFNILIANFEPDFKKQLNKILSIKDAIEFIDDFGTDFPSVAYESVHHDFLILRLYSYDLIYDYMKDLSEEFLYKIYECLAENKNPAREIIGLKNLDSNLSKYFYFNTTDARNFNEKELNMNTFQLKLNYKLMTFKPCLVPKGEKWVSIDQLILKRRQDLIQDTVQFDYAVKLLQKAYEFKMKNLEIKRDFFANNELQNKCLSLKYFDIDSYWEKVLFKNVEKKFISQCKIMGKSTSILN
jgi:hypothetical protein